MTLTRTNPAEVNGGARINVTVGTDDDPENSKTPLNSKPQSDSWAPSRRWRAAHLDASRAYGALQRAMKSGRLILPPRCPLCGADTPLDAHLPRWLAAAAPNHLRVSAVPRADPLAARRAGA